MNLSGGLRKFLDIEALLGGPCSVRVVQKFKKLSETPATAPMIAKLCMNDRKNREIAEKFN